MKLMHLSDLHLGIRVNGFSLLEDQAHILRQIVDVAERERPDAAMIAGDVYDKPVPPAEAVSLLDGFLCALAARGIEVFILAGNHDSPERLGFAARLLEARGVHLAPVYDGHVAPVTLRDDYGDVKLWMLPFLKSSQVRRIFPDAQIESATEALRAAVEAMQVDFGERNVLAAHQFVTGASVSDSEELLLGGAEAVDAEVFARFDYVALGHIHGPQSVGSPQIRYCGTPLKYSFSEAKQRKSVTLVTLKGKGETEIRTAPLTPLRDMRELRGTYMELTARSSYLGTDTRDYLHITLTDEEDIPDAVGKLRAIYPNLMKLDYDNCRTRAAGDPELTPGPERRTPLQLFAELYEKQNGRPMSEEQAAYTAQLIEQVWEEQP